MVAEVTITIKNSETKLTKDHLIYEDFSISEQDPILKQLIEEARKEFGDHEIESVVVKIKIDFT